MYSLAKRIIMYGINLKPSPKIKIIYTGEPIDTDQVDEILAEGVLKYLRKKGMLRQKPEKVKSTESAKSTFTTAKKSPV